MPASNYRLFFVVSVLLAIGHLSWGYQQLPDSVAVHFGAGGRPDGWASRQMWAFWYGFLLVTSGGLFPALAALMHRLPLRSFNLPEREYWMAPERREQTLRRLTEQLLLLGGATVLFDAGIMHLTLVANRAPEVRLDGSSFGWLLGIYLAFVALWTARLVRMFWRRRTPPGPEAG